MTTRFRPTPTCDLHVGHLWVAWHNWEDAARAGDRFLLIIDDICYNLQNVWQCKWHPHVWAERFAEDLAWAGCPTDETHFSTSNAEAHAEVAAKLGIVRCGLVAHQAFSTRNILSRETSSGPGDAYHEWLTLTRLVDDYTFGVEGFTRGSDLIGERQLYDHLWRRAYTCGMPPRQTYIPVVRREKNPTKEATANNAVSIRELREAGYSAREVIETLRECARLSALDGKADVVIPVGTLETQSKRVMQYRGTMLNLAIDLENHKADPWHDDLRAQLERFVGRMGWEGPEWTY